MAESPEQGASPSPATSKPPSSREDALAVVMRLRHAGHVAYFAGGCVRDLLLKRRPKDFDIATDAPPNRVRQLFPQTQAVGAAFGVILVRYGSSTIEVATFRSDGTYLDGRRPTEVHFTTAEQDARRRDFTINGLFLDPVENRVLDFVGGQADLAARVIRAIGQTEHRFEEDHLRMLRAVRFAARYDFQIEPATAEAIRHHAAQLARISPERVGEELRMILTPPSRPIAWRMLNELSLAPIIFRFLDAAKPTAPKGGFDLFSRIAPGQCAAFGLVLAATTMQWLLPAWESTGHLRSTVALATGRAGRALRQSLKISNEETDDLRGTLEGLGILLTPPPLPLATLKRFLARPTTHLTRDLLRAIAAAITSCNGEQAFIKQCANLELRLIELEKTEYAPTPLMNGDDLTAAGFTPGPLFKRLLHEVYDAQLEERVKDKEQALDIARRLASQTHADDIKRAH